MRLTNTYVAVEGERQGSAQLAYLFALFWTFVLLRFALSANLLDKFVSTLPKVALSSRRFTPAPTAFSSSWSPRYSRPHRVNDWELRVAQPHAVRGRDRRARALHFAARTQRLDGSSRRFLYRRLRQRHADAVLPAAMARMARRNTTRFHHRWCVRMFCRVRLRQRLLPYSVEEFMFRPTGLSEHSLVLGLFDAVGIGFVAASRWKIVAKVASSSSCCWARLRRRADRHRRRRSERAFGHRPENGHRRRRKRASA